MNRQERTEAWANLPDILKTLAVPIVWLFIGPIVILAPIIVLAVVLSIPYWLLGIR